MSDTDLPDHVRKNRAVWDKLSSEYARPGERAWASAEPTWGIWQLPERELRALPDVEGKDVIKPYTPHFVYHGTAEAINFGSGWFPTLRKRPGRSGYATDPEYAAKLTEILHSNTLRAAVKAVKL